MLLKAALAALLSFGMSTAGHASTARLQWTKNTEPGVAGYKVYYSSDPATFAGATQVDAHTDTSATISGLDPGKAYRFAVTAYDSAGNESAFSNIVECTEITPPSVDILSPENATSVSGTVSISINAADNVGVGKVEFYINDQLVATSTAAPYVYPWDTTSLAPGVYTVMAKAYDAAGNAAQSSASVIKSVPAPENPQTLQAAYDDAAAGSGVVHLAAANIIPASTDPDAECIANADKEVVISGGYDAVDQTREGVSVVTGALKIRAGKVIAGGITLRSPKS